MNSLINLSSWCYSGGVKNEEKIDDFSLKELFIPFTTVKAISYIILTGIIAYSNSLLNGFVQDDYSMIVENPVIRSINGILLAFKGANFAIGDMISDPYYRPLMTVYSTLVYSISGPNPFFYHFIQICLHIITAVLVYFLFKKFLSGVTACLLALIFVVHPVNAESVLYIASVQGILSTLAGLGILLLLGKRILTTKDYILICILFLTALLFKESALLFIPVAVFYTFLYHRQQALKIVYTTGGALFTYLLIRFSAVGFFHYQSVNVPLLNIPFSERMLTLPKIIFSYLLTFVFPQNLASIQLWLVRTADFNNFYLPFLIDVSFFLLLLVIGLWLYRSKHKELRSYVFFCSLFICGLFPYLQIVPLTQTVAERYFYVAGIGLLGLIGILGQSGKLGETKTVKNIIIVFALLVIAGFSVRTIIRTSDWRDGLTLALHDSTVTEQNYALENTLGYELSKNGRYIEAEKHYLSSLNLLPSYWMTLNNLGSAQYKYARTSKNNIYLNKAESSFKNAIKSSSNFSLPYENLATLYFYKEDYKKLQQFTNEAVKKFPQNAKLWFYLAISEYETDKKEDAIKHIQTALSLSPQNTQYRQIYLNMINNKPFKINRM